MPSAAILQAQQLQAALQQVASTSGLANSSLLPGLLQGGGDHISSQLSVMLPAQQQVTVCMITVCGFQSVLHATSWLGHKVVVEVPVCSLGVCQPI